MGYRNVVVGTDGSETAAAAVRHAAQLAKAFGARLTVVTAYAQTAGAGADATDVPDELRWMVTDVNGAEERAGAGKAVAAEVGLDDVRTRVGKGDPAEMLIEAAEDTGGDLIVVGSKGMASASRFVLGSVPNKVSHHAPCDVIIVHTV
ncbi:MAG: universal stress protein [Actinobacteria bacterium]|nr:universal stress protein [Actinomycetota bacterium]MBV8960941.1 universal stress protein [Actinomycetota bacterium]MBV9254531.1 universal stress protein [Actinomycetota bacterium]MBV9664436.1 universal stress protein [Actinomycetota bacterium]MBV9934618.1 universal stress protein [Actinomycetota bacterium]